MLKSTYAPNPISANGIFVKLIMTWVAINIVKGEI